MTGTHFLWWMIAEVSPGTAAGNQWSENKTRYFSSVLLPELFITLFDYILWFCESICRCYNKCLITPKTLGEICGWRAIPRWSTNSNQIYKLRSKIIHNSRSKPHLLLQRFRHRALEQSLRCPNHVIVNSLLGKCRLRLCELFDNRNSNCAPKEFLPWKAWIYRKISSWFRRDLLLHVKKFCTSFQFYCDCDLHLPIFHLNLIRYTLQEHVEIELYWAA